MRVSIAELPIDLNVPINYVEALIGFELFKSAYISASIIYNFQKADSLKIQGENLYSEEGLSWWKDNGCFNLAVTRNGEDGPYVLLQANENWHQIDIKSNVSTSLRIFRTFSEIAFRTTLLFYEGLVVHAAAVKWNGKGIVFSAPAETGKTTQANLWKENLGATVLNGDRPALRVINGKSIVYGTPWSGSSPDFQNASAPLAAIIMLEQDKGNSIHELSTREAIGRLAARCFLPYWDHDLMDLALSNLEKIIQSVPVYLLRCRPDREAVELVRQRVE